MRRRPRRPWCVPVIGVALCLVLAACGPGGQDEPETIDRRDVPFNLADVPSTTTTSTAPPTDFSLTVWFTADDRLVPVLRSSPRRASAQTALEALLDGPSEAEAALGISTVIPANTRVERVERRGDLVIIELEPRIGATGSNDTLAVAQLVMTATDVPGVDRVRFRVGGERVQVPRGDGSLARTVSRADYESLLE